MDNLVTLNNKPESLDSDVAQAFVTNVARVWEGLIDLELVQARYGLTGKAWAALADNVPLVRAVKTEMERRIYNDVAAKERAQLACKGAPEMLENILADSNAPARHRIEASKELRAYAHNGKDEQAAARDRFVITINLGEGHIETYDKPLRPIDQPMIDITDDKVTGADNG